ncbi:MAG TPA: polysaccharide deacetylase [Anaerolineales bacterium]|nr:polysaccharide deacetylase [Anaerolineales bacterium]
MSLETSPSVCLTFDFDAISLWLGPFKATSPSMISRGEFGVIGAKRILDLLDRYDIKSTWFVPGHTAETYPEAVADVYRRGHEIGHHGYCHENPVLLEEGKEREILEKGIAVLENITGEPPPGYRSPSWDMSPNTIRLLLEYGFTYDSSMMGSDFHPYWCRQGDRFDLVTPYQFGRPVDLVEMPVTWGLDDFPAFEYVSLSHKLYPGLRAPEHVFPIWMGDFDYLRQTDPEGVLILTMHPQVIGRGHRMLFLERLLEYMSGCGAKFVRLVDFVHTWKEGRSMM